MSNKRRNSALLIVSLVFLIVAIVYALYYYNYAKYYETTDNAYVSQNIVYITPHISGSVIEVLVDKTEYVKQGQLLGKLDTRDANISFNQAKENLAKAVREVKKLILEKEEAKIAINLAKIKLQKAKDDFLRNQAAKNRQAIALSQFERYRYNYKEAQENLKILQQKLKTIKSIVKDNNISNNPIVKSAILQLKKSYLNLQRCNIYSPVSGVIAKRNFNVGQRVSIKSNLLAIIPQNGFWVEANFKETQIKNIKIGQDVTLTSDLYGKDVVYHGKVTGISPGTGSVFSLIPPQNATGNWIKIIQRVPIKITLNPKELQKYPLRVGNSMYVKVNLKSKNSKSVQIVKNRVKNYSLPYKKALQTAEKIAQNIIRLNS